MLLLVGVGRLQWLHMLLGGVKLWMRGSLHLGDRSLLVAWDGGNEGGGFLKHQ